MQIKEISTQDLETSKSRVDKYTLLFENNRKEFFNMKQKRDDTLIDIAKGTRGSQDLLEELNFKLNILRESMSISNSDTLKAEEIYKREKREYKKLHYLSPKTLHNNQTKLEAINNKEPYRDDEMIEVFLNCKKYGGDWFEQDWVPDKDIEFYRKKFKRTYMAIEALVGVKIEYLKEGIISREVYWHEGELDKTGLQMEKILKELIKENKI